MLGVSGHGNPNCLELEMELEIWLCQSKIHAAIEETIL